MNFETLKNFTSTYPVQVFDTESGQFEIVGDNGSLKLDSAAPDLDSLISFLSKETGINEDSIRADCEIFIEVESYDPTQPTFSEKVRAVENGECNGWEGHFPVPPVSTSAWNTQDWINYVDSNNGWRKLNFENKISALAYLKAKNQELVPVRWIQDETKKEAFYHGGELKIVDVEA